MRVCKYSKCMTFPFVILHAFFVSSCQQLKSFVNNINSLKSIENIYFWLASDISIRIYTNGEKETVSEEILFN